MLSAAATRAAIKTVATARFTSSFRTYGSRTGDQFMNVYSLYPTNAITGSILYW